MCVDFDRLENPAASMSVNCKLTKQFTKYVSTPAKGNSMAPAKLMKKSAILQTPDRKFSYAPVPLVNGDPVTLVSESWYCWVEGKNAPTTAHASEALAMAEASRLAVLEPGKKVHVMQMAFRSLKACEAVGVAIRTPLI